MSGVKVNNIINIKQLFYVFKIKQILNEEKQPKNEQTELKYKRRKFFICQNEECKKKFKSKFNLKSHERTHVILK